MNAAHNHGGRGGFPPQAVAGGEGQAGQQPQADARQAGGEARGDAAHPLAAAEPEQAGGEQGAGQDRQGGVGIHDELRAQQGAGGRGPQEAADVAAAQGRDGYQGPERAVVAGRAVAHHEARQARGHEAEGQGGQELGAQAQGRVPFGRSGLDLALVDLKLGQEARAQKRQANACPQAQGQPGGAGVLGRGLGRRGTGHGEGRL